MINIATDGTENEIENQIGDENENGGENEIRDGDNSGGDGSVRPNNPTEHAERTTRPSFPSEQSGANIFFLASNRRGSVPVQPPTGTPRIETARRNRRTATTTATATATTTTTNLPLQLYYYYYWLLRVSTAAASIRAWTLSEASERSGGVALTPTRGATGWCDE